MLNLVVVIIGIFIVFSGYLYLQQERLIFMAPPVDQGTYKAFERSRIEIKREEKKLSGWRVEVDATSNKTLLYFGGNAEDVVYMNYEAERFHIKQLYTFNYPGYGESTGKSSQHALYESALLIYDRLVEQYGIDPDQLIVVGRSLGSSVATYVAAHRKAAGLILITPFDSIENVAANHYSLFPVSWLLNHRFPTIQYIGDVKSQLLFMVAEQDEIIAEENLQRLVEASHQKNNTIHYENVGHNSIQSHPDYYRDINEFIESIQATVH